MGQMRDLATHNRRDATRTSKRDKASLRATFRSILLAVEGGANNKADKVGLSVRQSLGHIYMIYTTAYIQTIYCRNTVYMEELAL